MAEPSEEDLNSKKFLGYQLLNALLEQNHKEALQLIKDGANIQLKNDVGWNCLHYASQYGYVDVVKLLLEKDKDLLMCQDKDGQIPLHKAAAHGQIQTILLLVSLSTKKFPKDYNERYPLESAVINSQKAAVELLLMVGSDTELQDWSWSVNPKTMTKVQKEVQALLKKHESLVSGFESSQIQFDLCHGDATQTALDMESLGVSVEVQNAKSDFFVYCCKLPLEFTDVKTNGDDQEMIFGDVYDVRTWDVDQKSIKVVVTVDDKIKKNQMLKLFSPMSGVAQLINSEEIEADDKAKTKVEIRLHLSKTGVTRFVFAAEEKKQLVQVSKEAVVVKMEAEPEAEINIPKNTFGSAGELALQIIDTSGANEDSVVPSENPEEHKSLQLQKQKEAEVLVTNVLDISMTNGQQPMKDIPVKLPITNSDPKAGFVVLSTSVLIPTSVDDWEIIPAEIDKSGKAAVFKISHFSFYAGANKKKVEENKAEVCEVLRASMLKIRKIEFQVLTRPPVGFDTVTDVVVICGSRRKLDMIQKKYSGDGYNLVSTSDLLEVPEGQEFKLSFEDNIVDKTRQGSVTLIFKGSDNESFIKFKICPRDMDEPPNGRISVSMKEIKIEEEVTEEIITGVFSCIPGKIKKSVKKIENQVHRIMAEFEVSAQYKEKPSAQHLTQHLAQHLATVPDDAYGKEEETNDDEDEDDVIERLIRTDESKIEVLKWRNLLTLRKELDEDEIMLLAMQLGFKLQKLIELTENCDDKLLAILKVWRGKRPHRQQVAWLIDALKRMQKRNLADQFEVNFRKETEGKLNVR